MSTALLFPPGHTKHKEIYDDAVKAVRDNLAQYRDIIKKSPDPFSIDHINRYNTQRDRIRHLKKNEQLIEEEARVLNNIDKKIKELGLSTEAQGLINELKQCKSVDQALCNELEKLLSQSGYAIAIKDYIDRTATQELKDRQAKVDSVQAILDEIDLPRKVREIIQAEQRIVDLTAKVSKLQDDLGRRKEDYDRVKDELSQLQVELSQRSTVTTAELEQLRSQVQIKEATEKHLKEKVDQLNTELGRKDEDLEKIQGTIDFKDKDIREKEKQFKKVQDEYLKQVAENNKLYEDHQKALGERMSSENVMDRQYLTEKSAKESLETHYKVLQNKLERAENELSRVKDLERKKVEELEDNIHELREENAAMKVEITKNSDLVATKNTEIATLESNIENAKLAGQHNSIRMEKLEEQTSEAKLQAARDVQEANRLSDIEITRLTTQLKAVENNLTTNRNDFIEEKTRATAKLREVEENAGIYREQIVSHIEKQKALKREVEDERKKAQEAKREKEQAINQKTLASSQINDLKRTIEEYRLGEPIAEAELTQARTKANHNQHEYNLMKQEKEKVEARLVKFDEMLTRYTFGSNTDLHLDYNKINEALRACDPVQSIGVLRAIDGLKYFMEGLPIHPPLTGLQLFIEATMRPDEFTSSKVLAFLKNPNTHGYNDYGFLNLTVEALLSVPAGKLQGFRALAVLDILQAWMHIDSVRSQNVEKYLDSYKSLMKRPSSTSTFDTFIEVVHTSVQKLVKPDSNTFPTRGASMLSKVAFHEGLQLQSIAMGRSESSVASQRQTHDNQLVSFTSEPPYFIYVEDRRIVWLRPEQITVRVETSQGASSVVIHDNQMPHMFEARRLSLNPEDFENICEIFKHVTFLD